MTDWNTITQRIAAGDAEAFKVCFDQLHQEVYGYAFHYFRSAALAEDMVQEVFAKVWSHRQSLDPSQGIKAYIYRTARNTIFSQLKRAACDRQMREYVFYRQPAQRNETEDRYLHDELLGLYKEAITMLPPQRQLVYTMSRDEGMTHDEIAEQLTLSKNTVKDQIVKASHFIRNYIRAHTGKYTTYLFLVAWVAATYQNMV
ncbi:RNA polymerase sigma factor [Parapedobacter sp.]